MAQCGKENLFYGLGQGSWAIQSCFFLVDRKMSAGKSEIQRKFQEGIGFCLIINLIVNESSQKQLVGSSENLLTALLSEAQRSCLALFLSAPNSKSH
jgi:phosphoribosylaminoimidazole (AIR) synthetase